jgi:hypothetical protein
MKFRGQQALIDTRDNPDIAKVCSRTPSNCRVEDWRQALHFEQPFTNAEKIDSLDSLAVAQNGRRSFSSMKAITNYIELHAYPGCARA